MNKPLSKTHPTIAKKYYAYALDGVEEKYYDAEAIQLCTVDVAEYERLKAEVEHLRERLDDIIEADFFCEDCGQNVVSSEHKRGINCADCEPANSGLRAEVERLKKQVEAERQLRYDLWEQQKAEGVAEGERRSVAEIERLKKELESAWVTINDLDARLERACEQHEKLYSKGFDEGVKQKHGKVEHVGYQEGVAEGERRAMERVKEAIKTSLTAYQVETKLGLGEEEKR